SADGRPTHRRGRRPHRAGIGRPGPAQWGRHADRRSGCATTRGRACPGRGQRIAGPPAYGRGIVHLTTKPASEGPGGDLATLARGGQVNFLGFLLRLAARMPFLFIAGRHYGADALGRFASALVVVELTAMLCTIGEKRGLAQRLSESDADQTHLVADGLTVALLAGSATALVLWLVPAPLFPSGDYTQYDRLIVLAIPALALTEILLAAQAYRYDIAATVRARAVVEPWTISIMAGVFALAGSRSGLS